MRLILLSVFLVLLSNVFSQQDTAVSINIVSLITKGYGCPVKSYTRHGKIKKEVYSDWNGNVITVYYRKGKYRRYKYRESGIVRNQMPPRFPEDEKSVPINQ